MVDPRARTEAVEVARAAVTISERRACGLLLTVRGSCRYHPVSREANTELRQKLHELAMARQESLKGCPPSFRLWSAGCSSGEEPYSIAMTVAGALDRLCAWDLKIFGSDIDTSMLERARAAMYPRDSLGGLPAEVVKQNFLSGTGEYADCVKVKPEIRNLVSFGRLNLVDDSWPFRGKFDAIFCRNVIIYFDHPSQERVLRHFAQYLKPGGLLFSGHSENLFWLTSVSSQWDTQCIACEG